MSKTAKSFGDIYMEYHYVQAYRSGHMLCGSGITVLTATGIVNGNHCFSTPSPQIRPPLTRRQKCVTGDYIGNPYLYQIWCKFAYGETFGQMREI